MLAAIRNQHPEWVDAAGQCQPCESYLHELATHPATFEPEPTES